MKTTAEIIAAVFAECERLCQNKSGPAPIECGHLSFGYVEDDGVQMEAWFIHIAADTHPMSLYELAGEQVWLAAYRLLGLESAELEARNAALVKSENLHKSVVLKLSKERGDALRRNDALVKALGEIRTICVEVRENPDYTFNGNEGEMFERICTRAIEANGKEQNG